MTNERAIELLKRISDSQFDGEYGDERREALSMAVKALEGDGDTIYRKAAIVDALEGVDWYHINEATGKLVHGSTSDMESWYKVDDVRKAIEKLQSAQPTQTNADSTHENTLDCIDRQAAVDAVSEGCQEFRGIFERCKEKLLALPSAQPERKKGKWIEKENSPFYCSVCGTYQYSASWEIKNKEYNFCPRCGARMEGEKNEIN